MTYRPIPPEIRRQREEAVRIATEWREAAKQDGWSCRATYEGHESVETAFTLEREGFKAIGLARPMKDNGMWPCGEISIWGPDRLQILPPFPYDWEQIKAGVRRCNYCNATDVETVRISFAGRCCRACRPELAKKYERPGWTR